jgi:hypothetical protein
VKPATTQPGQTWEYEFDWFGLVVSGNSRCTKSEPAKLHQFQTVTGNPSTWTYLIESDGTNTRLTLEVEYEIPGNVLARYASQPVFEKMNQERAREIVANIKTMLESQPCLKWGELLAPSTPFQAEQGQPSVLRICTGPFAELDGGAPLTLIS